MKKISVITVTYNCKLQIETTLRSVFNQTKLCDLQYIVVDGGSTDGTLDIIKAYPIDILISEADEGIYDAMNKGAKFSTCDYCLFLNAGDWLASDHVIEQLITIVEKNYGDVILGKHAVQKGNMIVSKFNQKMLSNHRMNFSHQAIIVPRDLIIRFPFNIRYRYAADFDQLCKIRESKHRFCYVQTLIAVVDSGGVSDVNRFQVIKEWVDISGLSLVHIYYIFINIFGMARKGFISTMRQFYGC